VGRGGEDARGWRGGLAVQGTGGHATLGLEGATDGGREAAAGCLRAGDAGADANCTLAGPMRRWSMGPGGRQLGADVFPCRAHRDAVTRLKRGLRT